MAALTDSALQCSTAKQFATSRQISTSAAARANMLPGTQPIAAAPMDDELRRVREEIAARRRILNIYRPTCEVSTGPCITYKGTRAHGFHPRRLKAFHDEKSR